ncbi:DUF4382 domain-containing protein [Haloplanus halobius]|uniref:DUF4382 domain-containing protein n=1 Tax=Haloplanus halobius TaxID=2934938 RepID=UPI00200E3AE2|nr:DUF4382 domain-containing protein [Haloplanus sp. XH21]
MTESDGRRLASRRDYLRATGGLAAAGMAGLAGCAGGSDGETGVLATQVTDQPGDIGDFESCIVTIEGIWVKPGTESDDEDDETTETETTATTETEETATETPDESDEREYHEFDEPQEADLVDLQGSNTALVGEHELETGEYAYLQLDVTNVDATLDDGSDATVDTPGNAPLQFKHAFEIRANTRTVFTADFTPVRRGQTGRYLLQPVARGTSVEYEPVESETETEAEA